jgi:DNA-binding transcriptional LysR family regulator
MDISAAVDAIVADQQSDVTGLLRLSAPPSISDTLLAPLLGAFQTNCPRVQVRVLVTDRFVDHIDEQVDVAFRLRPLDDSALVARTVLSYRHQLVASPTYLATCRAPSRPKDLLAHRLLAFSHWQPRYGWQFMHVKGGEPETINFQPHFSMNDYTGLATALLAGGGIGDLPPIVQPALLQEGRLVEVMPEWRFRCFDLSLVHLGNRHMPRHVHAFKDFALQALPKMFPNLPT